MKYPAKLRAKLEDIKQDRLQREANARKKDPSRQNSSAQVTSTGKTRQSRINLASLMMAAAMSRPRSRIG